MKPNLVVVGEVASDPAYDQLVRLGIDQVKQDDQGEWRWGDLINKVLDLPTLARVGVNNGAKAQIEQFIKDTGCPHAFTTLRDRAQVAKVFPVGKRIASFQAHKVLQGVDYQHLLVPGMGWAAATEALKQARTPKPEDPKPTDTGESKKIGDFESDVEDEQKDWDSEPQPEADPEKGTGQEFPVSKEAASLIMSQGKLLMQMLDTGRELRSLARRAKARGDQDIYEIYLGTLEELAAQFTNIYELTLGGNDNDND